MKHFYRWRVKSWTVMHATEYCTNFCIDAYVMHRICLNSGCGTHFPHWTAKLIHTLKKPFRAFLRINLNMPFGESMWVKYQQWQTGQQHPLRSWKQGKVGQSGSLQLLPTTCAGCKEWHQQKVKATPRRIVTSPEFRDSTTGRTSLNKATTVKYRS